MDQVILLLISHCVCHGLNTNCPQKGLTHSGPICVYCPKLIDAGEKRRERAGERREGGRQEVKQRRLEGVKKSKEMREAKRVQEEQ